MGTVADGVPHTKDKVVDLLMLANDIEKLFQARAAIERSILRHGEQLRDGHVMLSDHQAQHLGYCIKNDCHLSYSQIQSFIRGSKKLKK